MTLALLRYGPHNASFTRRALTRIDSTIGFGGGFTPTHLQCINWICHRLVVVVGSCSIHDHDQAIAYAKLLKAEAGNHAKHLHIVMRDA